MSQRHMVLQCELCPESKYWGGGGLAQYNLPLSDIRLGLPHAYQHIIQTRVFKPQAVRRDECH